MYCEGNNFKGGTNGVLLVQGRPRPHEELGRLVREACGDGCKVYEASSVAAAEQLLATHNPHIVVMDIPLPLDADSTTDHYGGGYRLLELMKERIQQRQVRPIVFTDRTNDRMDTFMRRMYGVEDCVPRPTSPEELRGVAARIASYVAPHEVRE